MLFTPVALTVIVHSSPTGTATGVTVLSKPDGAVIVGVAPSTLSSMQTAPVVGHVVGPAEAGSGTTNNRQQRRRTEPTSACS